MAETPKYREPILLLGPPKSALSKFFPNLLANFTFLTPFDFPPSPLPQFLLSHAKSIRVLFCISGGGSIPITSEILSCIPSLQCIVNAGVGLDHIDLKECGKRGVRVTNAGEAFTEDVADCAVGLLVDVLRRVSEGDRFVRGGEWVVKGEYPLGRKVGGKRVGIIGLGSIGSEVAKRLTPFGCIIAYNSRKKKDSVSFSYYSNVIDLATDSDVLILCCALTDKTHHLIDKNVLSALGKEGIIINIGRGALIDEKELVDSLVNGEIGGAGLDVFENEPNVPKELFELDNVVLSPHRAVVTPESFSALQDVCIANLEAFFSNKPLLSPVSYE